MIKVGQADDRTQVSSLFNKGVNNEVPGTYIDYVSSLKTILSTT